MLTLKTISELIGVSGYEESIREHIKNSIKDIDSATIRIDRIGNLFIHKNGDIRYPRIMVISHMDEVGLQVMRLNDDGSAIVKTLGNLKTWNTMNQIVSTVDGMKQGIVFCTEPEGIRAYDFEKLVIIPTVGKFEIGDVLGFESELIETDKLYIGKALDNRVSCYVLYEIIKKLNVLKNEVDFVFSVQEEVGMRGARVAISELSPDIVMVLDVSPVGERNSLKMGGGIGIKLSDSIGISSKRLVDQIERIANEEKIKYQHEVSDCGTSELIITNEKDYGAERIGISIPCKNIHSSLTQVNKEDLEMGLHLVKAIFQKGLS